MAETTFCRTLLPYCKFKLSLMRLTQFEGMQIFRIFGKFRMEIPATISSSAKVN
jgi:hypothetical protein